MAATKASTTRTFIVAEAGVNHQGNFRLALELADAAKAAGADAVKYQCFSSQKLWGDDRIKHLELRFADFERLHEYCKQIGIEFMCTPFGVEELLFLKPMLQRVKIASGCITRKPLLEAAAATGLPVVLSTGMSAWEDVHQAVSMWKAGTATILHCTSSYPCRLEDVNLRAMVTLAGAFPYPVGYSDHTSGITVALAAVALGAVMIEKHLTLDRNMEGPDHKTSITPKEFKAMRIGIMEVEYALGDGVKRVLDCEQELRKAWRGER